MQHCGCWARDASTDTPRANNVTRKSKFNPRVSSRFLIVPLLAVACVHSPAIAAPNTTPTVEVQTPCSGNCAPTLVALTGGEVVALWASQNGQLWAQSLDSKNGALLGRNVDLGYLATPGGAFAQQPLAIALPDGDLVLVGLLRDGRVTFARGSDDAGRRVAPKVILPASSSDVLSIAAAPHGAGVTLLVLRAPEGYDPKTRRSPTEMHVELHMLGPTGETGATPLHWTTAFGRQPRIASCEGESYIAWEWKDDLLVTSVSSQGQRSSPRVLPGRKSLGSPGPIACEGPHAVLVTSWQRDVLASQNLAEISIARITPTSTKLQWKTIKLSDAPRDLHVGEGSLAAQLQRDQLYVSIGTNARSRLVRVPLGAQKVQTLPLGIPPHQSHCLAVADGARALCAVSKSADDAQCAKSLTRTTLSFIGYEPLAPAREVSTFWKVAAPIPDPQAPSASELTWRRGRVMCGEPGWSELREALEAWCNRVANTNDWRAEPSLCARDVEHSLRYQAIHCTNEPLNCGPSRFRVIPSVDRVEFERGSRIELSYVNCSIYFSREGGKLEVTNGECTGE